MSSPAENRAAVKTAAPLAYVLDDEQQIGTLVCHVLVACGFAPRQFIAPMPFLAGLKAALPELIVLDLALGQSDAVEMIRHLEILKYPGKVLLISGRDESTLAEITQIGERRGLSMLPPLRKPFRAADLKSRLSAHDNERRSEVSEPRPDVKPPKKPPIRVEEALRNHWLELWYQPKIDLKSLSVCGAEGLLRARHPEHGILFPESILPPAGDQAYRSEEHTSELQSRRDL